MPETDDTQGPLRFNVYGRFLIELRREGDAWIAYRVDGEGRRRRDNSTVIPPDLPEGKVASYLDDIFHEWAKPGDVVTRV
ncbi:DUF7661 family protein [Microvirga calopogonii]|uniref:DUF7661 family protein n=1 Tax=Microvirga calopogonii TaxID=2078013 RepID=UPI000E0D2C85|nr:hypothetical protein [Microvirga calopogonii]